MVVSLPRTKVFKRRKVGQFWMSFGGMELNSLPKSIFNDLTKYIKDGYNGKLKKDGKEIVSVHIISVNFNYRSMELKEKKKVK